MTNIGISKAVAKIALGSKRSRGDSRLQRTFLDMFGRHPKAGFKVIFWDGTAARIGPETKFLLRFKTKKALKGLLEDVSLGFGEGYTNGGIEVEGDLRQVMRLGYETEQLWAEGLQGGLAVACRKALLTMQQRNTRRRDRRHIAHHYDLGDDFYRLWLDRNMVYSCAYFRSPEDTLEKAQEQKMDYCLRKLRLEPDDSLLDIGCGWGGLLLRAAGRYGCRGLGITLSERQAERGSRCIAEAGLADRLSIRYQDYRELPEEKERFSKLVSVGMFEHVGKRNITRFFAVAAKMLEPGGLFLLHTIGRLVPGGTNPWLKKYIFPGCYIPGLAEIFRAAAAAGLHFVDLEDLRTHYGRTLDDWLDRFEGQNEKVKERFDDRFIRMWRFYLCGCSASFWYGDMHVFQLLFSSGKRNDLPLTRDWMSWENIRAAA